MMTKGKRWMACVLAAILLMTTAVGCGKTDSGGSSSPEESTGSEAPAASAGEQGTEAQTRDLTSLRGNMAPTQEEIDLVNNTLNDSYLENVYDDVEFGSDYSAYPNQEDVTLTVWMGKDECIEQGIYQNSGENPVFKQIQELTGINIEFINPTVGEESTEFNLMMTDGNLPDIIYNPYYSGGVLAGVEDGVFLEMSELIDQYMPNYKSILESNPSFSRDVHTDDGTTCAIYGYTCLPGTDWYFFMVKQEALDKTGLPVPETVDEWNDFLIACKDAGYTCPLVLDDFPGTMWTGAISAAYGSYPGFFLDENNKVAYGPVQEGTKQYLQLMHDWYSKGIFNADCFRGVGTPQDHIALMLSDESAASYMYGYYYADENIDYQIVENPVLNKGDTPICMHGGNSYVGTPAVITSSCKNVEAACAFLDFGFTKKGWELYNWGAYGDMHLIDENGAPCYYEGSKMVTNPENLSIQILGNKYRVKNFTCLRDEEHANAVAANPGTQGWITDRRIELLGLQDHSHILPSFTLTVEESERVNLINTNLGSLKSEYFTKIIRGDLPVDAWDDFVEEAKSMGMEVIVETYQAAVDRYYAR